MMLSVTRSILTIAAGIIFVSGEVKRPDPFFTVSNQVVYTITTHPKNGGGSRMRSELIVKTVQMSGASVFSSLDYTQYNKNDAVYMRSQWNFGCDTTCFYVHATNWTYGLTLPGYQNQFSGDSLQYPLNMKVGDTLANAWAKRMTEARSYTTQRDLIFSDRVVAGIDTLLTPAGVLGAFRIEMTLSGTSKTTYKSGDRSTDIVKASVTEWFAPEIGIVKSETRDPEYGVTRMLLESYKK